MIHINDNITIDDTEMQIIVAALSKYAQYLSHRMRESINKSDEDVSFYTMMLSQTETLYHTFKTEV